MKVAAPLRALAAALLLSGCAGSPSPIEPPTPLADFPAALRVEPLWTAQLGSGTGTHYLRLGPAMAGRQIYAANRAGSVGAYYADSGVQAWRTELGVAIGGGPVEAGELLLIGADAEVIALDRANGAVRWRAPVSSEVLADPVRSGDLVVAHTVDGGLYGLDAASGAELWRAKQSVPLLSLRGAGAPVVAGEAVVAGFANGRIAAYAARDGRLAWETAVAVPRGRTELERMTDADGRIAVSQGMVFAAGFQGRVAALALGTGRAIWGREISSYQGVALAGDSLFVSDDGGAVWSLAQGSGATLWRQPALANRELTTPVVQGEAVVVGDYDGYLHWLAREDGRLLGRARVETTLERFPLSDDYDDPQRDNPEERHLLAAPVVSGEYLFAIDRRGVLAAFRVMPNEARPQR